MKEPSRHSGRQRRPADRGKWIDRTCRDDSGSDLGSSRGIAWRGQGDRPSARPDVSARFFTEAGIDPFDEVEWELARGASSATSAAKSFSSSATSRFPSPGRSRPPTSSSRSISAARSARRSASTASGSSSAASSTPITEWARTQKYFATDEDLQAFSDDLKHILVYQKAAFNSPVWFNCGFEKAPQCSACFINSVQDTMDSILTLAADRGHAVQVRIGHRHQPVADPLVEGAAGRRRHGVGPGVVHEGLRRVCRRHQVGRQDAPRGQDGHPRRRSPGHRRVHQLQGRGREEGLGAHRRRL